ncbi:37S ribosomal protein S7, mitochondrial [Erysiphe neolycopersici]|uniref:Small ribosomal subunit protein uS7m n=1 Tax=Erysiphe neolycopersici TaxID=212602 RepID=A0A420HFA2_9PEZI|nr:37S ribosomal protein S7, mitochondrial [Erysiphe neolycopersici]
MLLSSNLLKVNSSSVLKLCSTTRIFQSNEPVIFIRRKLSGSRSPDKSNQGLGHTNEEAAEFSKIFGETKPDLNRSAKVQDLMRKGVEARNSAPKVIKDDLQKKSAIDRDIQKAIDQSRNSKDLDSTLTNLIAIGKLENISQGNDIDEPVELKLHDPLVEGHKFGLPELPIPPDANFKYREDTLVTQVTNLLMKDGKKGVAQRNMSFILNVLRTAPPPKFNPARPLIPGHPPAHHLSLDPIGYLTLAIDSVAPLLRIRSERGAAGGGAALSIPVPLRKRQRRRQAVMWIFDSVNKRTSRGSGRGTFAQRFADEVISIVEGKSSAWDKRLMVHKAGTTSRNNINFKRRK